MTEEERCCPLDYGGSHYHCARCGEVSSQFGHYVAFTSPGWAQERCETLGLPFPFAGFTCDPDNLKTTRAPASSLSDRLSAADGRGRDDGAAREPLASGKSSVAPGAAPPIERDAGA